MRFHKTDKIKQVQFTVCNRYGKNAAGSNATAFKRLPTGVIGKSRGCVRHRKDLGNDV
jgi:hypothetical protein